MDAIIFDVDGTLWDSRVPVAHSWNRTLSEVYGRPIDHSPEYLGTQFGKAMDEIAAFLFPDKEPEEQARLAARCFEEETRWLYREPGTLYPGVEDTLAKLSARWPCYIVSNCQRGYIQVMLATTGLGKYFSGTLCYGDTQTPKGKTLVTLCKQYDLRDPVYVGDTQGDADACAWAGIPMIYAAYGLGRVAHPWKSIRRFDELINVLE